jgi:hypothetical protein
MQFSLETLAALATIAGTVIGILALLQSQFWLVLTSLCLACICFGAGAYARRERLALRAASTAIEGQSIDSLNMANLRRRVNRTFAIQEAHHTARIEGEDMEITWAYSGYCRAAHANSMEFSVDADNSIPFDRLKCVAYDLSNDPERLHEIRPLLISPEGISKKISVPFLEPLRMNEPFSLLLKCLLPGCMKAEIGYYTSTLSFAQDLVRRCVVHLIFAGTQPEWVRVYECTGQMPAALVKTLSPIRGAPGCVEYVDDAADRKGQSARVYMFKRHSA